MTHYRKSGGQRDTWVPPYIIYLLCRAGPACPTVGAVRRADVGSESSAASGRRSEMSEWPRPKFQAAAVRQRQNFGHRNRAIDPYGFAVIGKNASHARRHERRKFRGSTLVYRSNRPIHAGQTEGICIPRAPGRTFRAASQGGLQPTAAPLLAKLWRVLFPINALCSLQPF